MRRATVFSVARFWLWCFAICHVIMCAAVPMKDTHTNRHMACMIVEEEVTEMLKRKLGYIGMATTVSAVILLAGCGGTPSLPQPVSSVASTVESMASADPVDVSGPTVSIPSTSSMPTSSSTASEETASVAPASGRDEEYAWTFVDEEEWNAKTDGTPCQTKEEIVAYLEKYGSFYHVLFANDTLPNDNATRDALYKQGKGLFQEVADILLNVDKDTPNYYMDIVQRMDVNYATQAATAQTAVMYPCILEYGDLHVDGEVDMFFVSVGKLSGTEILAFELSGNVPCKLIREGKESDVNVHMTCMMNLYPDGVWKPVTYGDDIIIMDRDTEVQTSYGNHMHTIPLRFSKTTQRLDFTTWQPKADAASRQKGAESE